MTCSSKAPWMVKGSSPAGTAGDSLKRLPACPITFEKLLAFVQRGIVPLPAFHWLLSTSTKSS